MAARVLPSRKLKDDLLGMPFGTASHRLRKLIMFSLVKRLGENFCHQCGSEILSADDLSIEHKQKWQACADPVEAFFDLENISFSHIACNVADSLGTKRPITHGTQSGFRRGCRCEPCVTIKRSSNAKFMANWRAGGNDKSRPAAGRNTITGL